IDTKTDSTVTSKPLPNDTLAAKRSDTLEAPKSELETRSPSPVGRLKEAFTPSRKSSPKPAKEKGSERSAKGGGGGIEGGESGDSKQPDVLDEARQSNELAEVKEEPKRSRKPVAPQSIDTTVRPETPPNGAVANVTPQTLITPPTPIEADRPGQRSPTRKNTTSTGGTSSPPGNFLSSRRMRIGANPPSKLSNAQSAPLTPAVEEVKTPGGTLVSPQAAGGSFFSGFFSAAQNAANQLTNTIASSGGQRSRSGTGPEEKKPEEAGGEEVILPHAASDNNTGKEGETGEKRPLAIETLGSGNLSLSHLGIAESESESQQSDASSKAQNMQNDEASAVAEDDAAAKAVSAAYLDGTNGEKAG
ncbi:hypothetical protein LTS18_001133, partial [Coniosporium uncinatum]